MSKSPTSSQQRESQRSRHPDNRCSQFSWRQRHAEWSFLPPSLFTDETNTSSGFKPPALLSASLKNPGSRHALRGPRGAAGGRRSNPRFWIIHKNHPHTTEKSHQEANDRKQTALKDYILFFLYSCMCFLCFWAATGFHSFQLIMKLAHIKVIFPLWLHVLQ